MDFSDSTDLFYYSTDWVMCWSMKFQLRPVWSHIFICFKFIHWCHFSVEHDSRLSRLQKGQCVVSKRKAWEYQKHFTSQPWLCEISQHITFVGFGRSVDFIFRPLPILDHFRLKWSAQCPATTITNYTWPSATVACACARICSVWYIQYNII
jgi:hypothetical protein